MPPEIEPMALPTTRGKDAAEWLEVHGLVDRKPFIRSSDYGMIRRCPFTYYLCRRLGLVKMMRYSEALSRGTWVHHRFALITLPPEEAMRIMYRLLHKRLTELTRTCKEIGIDGEPRREILHREERDFLVATAWFEASLTVPTITMKSGDKVTLGDWLLNDDEWAHVGQELLIKDKDRVVQPDLILHNKHSNKLWIVDFKTCAGSPHLRLQTCPWEFQTQHYFHTVRSSAIHHSLLNVLDVPSNVKIAGVMHIAVRKPSIQFGMSDRPYTLDTTPLKSGPRKGEPRNTKKYAGEPSPDLYKERCMSWYHALDDYEHLAPTHATDPPVNISFTPAEVLLASDLQELYTDRLHTIRAHRCYPCQPNEFEVGEVAPQHSRLPTYAPFIMTPVSRWPSIIAAENFTVRDRDDAELADGVHASFNHLEQDTEQ